MSRLIAMVATAVLINGVRTVVQPGELLPDLPEHDEGELLANGMAMDPETGAANDKAKTAEEAAALNAFREAREKVKAEKDSTESAEPPEPATPAEPPASAPTEPVADAQKAKPAAKTAPKK